MALIMHRGLSSAFFYIMDTAGQDPRRAQKNPERLIAFCTLFDIVVGYNYCFMSELKDFQSAQLLTLLTKETISYYKLLGYDANEEKCTQCINRINGIRSELESRRNSGGEKIFQRRSIAAPSNYSFKYKS